MKKVCHMTSGHKRYDLRILEKQCVSLARQGYDVTLIVNDNGKNEIYKDVKIISTGFYAQNRLDRFLNTKKHFFELAKKIDADVYQFHDPDLIPVGNKLKREGKKIIFDSHENVPKQILSKKWLPKLLRKPISYIYEIYEKKSVKKYDAVISVTYHIVDRLKRINRNTIMITNYPIIKNKTEIDQIDVNADIIKNKYVCFAGGVSTQWKHENIISAIDRLEDINYILAGSGDNSYLEELKRLSGWKKVDYRGRITHAEVKKIYSSAIAGMAINQSLQSRIEGTLGNTKLFEYMEAGLPVICSNHKLWKEIVEKYNCGICVNPNKIEEIKEAIKFVRDNPRIAKMLGDNGRLAVVSEYNWSSQEKILFELYCNMLN
jgi:glycosyltransferase involved in cell wall biosynthesis